MASHNSTRPRTGNDYKHCKSATLLIQAVKRLPSPIDFLKRYGSPTSSSNTKFFSTQVSPRALKIPQSFRSPASKTSPRLGELRLPHRKHKKNLKLNRIPVPLTSSKKKIEEYFNKQHSRTKSITQKLTNQNRIQKIEPTKLKRDSFDKRYDAQRHILRTNTGKVFLPRKAAALFETEVGNQDAKFDITQKPKTWLSLPSRSPNLHFETKIDYKSRRSELWRRAQGAIHHFIQLKLHPQEIYQLRQKIPQKPYGIEGGQKFLQSVKIGNIQQVKEMLAKNKWLIHVTDKLQQTCLHWAAKRNLNKMIPLLIQNGAFIDARDQLGRTPAFIATLKGSHEANLELLFNHANCWIRTFVGQRALDIAKNHVAYNCIRHSMLLTKMLKWVPKSQRADVWRSEAGKIFKL